jgi:hypothetical protein
MRLIFIVALCISLLGCRKPSQETHVRDPTRPETILLTKQAGQDAIHYIDIRTSGSIVGSARIQLILNGGIYKEEVVNGKFSFTWGGDWYADSAELRYIPDGVTSGSVTFNYAFRDI